jgi:pimeloyl-ACP methyl ester carboxylesterase
MTSSAKRIHDAVHTLGVSRTSVVGHDIGLMVAYAYASMYPSEVQRLALMDAFLPGVRGWDAIYDDPYHWHFRFFGPTPEALVKGRERTYFDYFWNDFAADKNHSIPDTQRAEYVAAYSRPGRMGAGFAYFASWPKTAAQFTQFARTPLTMPMLTIGGAKSLGTQLAAQGKLVAKNVQVVIVPNAGHWLMEERPAATMSTLEKFLSQ